VGAAPRQHRAALPRVLRGDRGCRGPAPGRRGFARQRGGALPASRQRLAVRPGVTGLAQVQLGADTDIASVRRKLLYDLHYIDHLGPWLDLRVLAATAVYVLANPFRLTQRLRPVPR